MNRRTFIVALTGVAAGATGVGLIVRRRGPSEPAILGTVDCAGGREVTIPLGDLLSRPDQVRPLGRAILAAQRIRPGRGEIAERLFAGDAWAEACRRGARPVLLERIRSDFREDRIVTVHGWILSRTEADLYALAEIALSSS